MAGTDGKALAGKVALVTGSGKNIGRTIALRLAADGAKVVVNGRSDRAAIEAVAGEIRSAGGEATALLADVSQPDAVAAMVEQAVARFGGIDIAISNAGLRRQTPFLEMGFEEWREIMSVALDGAFLLARATMPHMVRRGGGAFVGMSGMSHHIGMADRAHADASKAGLEGFVRGLATEMAPHGITVNTVAPGAVDTTRGASAGGPLPASVTAGIPLGRRATVDEIAATVHFLVSPDAAYITGQTIHVNGGRYYGK